MMERRPERRLSRLDRVLSGLESALGAIAGDSVASRPSPAAEEADRIELSAQEREHAAGLMRVNHTGEVCAQALYFGQAALSRSPDTRAHLLHAANEETDHLAWCAERLRKLDDRPSLLNPIWYAGSYAIGAAAALAGDRISLGFVMETERQVEAHLGDHIQRLPAADRASRAILAQMQQDEAEHGRAARAQGGAQLRTPIPQIMRVASGIMKAVAYRI